MWHAIKTYLLYTWGGLHRYFGNQNNLAKEHRRAVHYFARAYEANPKMQRALLARAILLGRELGDEAGALADLALLLEQDPTYGPALFNRALVYQQMGKYQAALADLEAYLRLPQPDAYRQPARRLRQALEGILESGGA